MDTGSIALILAVIAFVAVIIYILFLFNMIPISAQTPTPTPTFTPTPTLTPTPTPTLTPTPTPTLTPTTVTVEYVSLNGSLSTITLPQQAGTTIEILQPTDVVLSATLQPYQEVIVSVIGPNGKLLYQEGTYANANGQWSTTISSSSLIFLNNGAPGNTFLVTLSLGTNYYFYVEILSPSKSP